MLLLGQVQPQMPQSVLTPSSFTCYYWIQARGRSDQRALTSLFQHVMIGGGFSARTYPFHVLRFPLLEHNPSAASEVATFQNGHRFGGARSAVLELAVLMYV